MPTQVKRPATEVMLAKYLQAMEVDQLGEVGRFRWVSAYPKTVPAEVDPADMYERKLKAIPTMRGQIGLGTKRSVSPIRRSFR